MGIKMRYLLSFGLCVFEQCLLGKKKLPGIEYMDIEVEDTEFSNISSYFDEAVRFINDAREKVKLSASRLLLERAAPFQGGKVIIYCCAGISRSAAICMMYLVMHEGLTLRKAYYEVER